MLRSISLLANEVEKVTAVVPPRPPSLCREPKELLTLRVNEWAIEFYKVGMLNDHYAVFRDESPRFRIVLTKPTLKLHSIESGIYENVYHHI